MLSRKYNKNFYGFTLVELILVIAIMALLSTMAYSASTGFLIRNRLQDTVNNAVSSIRMAQLNSQSSKAGGSWGVKITGDEIVLFQGNDYATRNPVYDETFSVPASVTTPDVELVFARLSGNVGSSELFAISDNIGSSVTISINEIGIVDVD